jgi:hypothetical protein
LSCASSVVWPRGCVNAGCRRRMDRLNISSIELLLAEAPVRTVVLLRLPLLTGGILNYMFSLSNTLAARHMLVRGVT